MNDAWFFDILMLLIIYFLSVKMQFSTKSVRDCFARTQTPTLHSIKQSSRDRNKQTLAFMQEWTSDLMER